MQHSKNQNALYFIETEGPHRTLTIQQGVLYSPLGMKQKAPSLSQLAWRWLCHPLRGKKIFIFHKVFINLTS